MYKIIFENGTVFIGGEPHDSKWNLISDQKIISFEYELFGKIIFIEGYEAYNHLVERINIFNSEKIAKIIIMCKYGKVTHCITFDLENKKLFRDVKKFNEEYNNKSVSGWKVGKRTDNPIIKMLK